MMTVRRNPVGERIPSRPSATQAAKVNFSSDMSKALKWSLIIHGALAIIVVSFSIVAKAFEKPAPVPHIFELQGIKGPQHIGAPGRLAGDSRLQRSDKAGSMNLPSLEKGTPAPTAAPAEDAASAKATAKAKATADAKPAKNAKTGNRSANAKSKSQGDKPKLVSYEEFMRENGKSSGTGKAKKKSGSSGSGKNVRIDASGMVGDLRKNLAWGDDGFGGGGAVGGTGITSGEMDALDAYFQRVRALIDANFEEPRGVMDQVSTMVQFTIQANGVVTSVGIVTSSGSDEFDRAAVKAVRDLGTLDPPPGNTSYTRKIEFVGKQNGE
jgi:TonB family protein